jgi:sterol desaturase/sphingolipid hydroxylase (fatty acid hydroxylase superfamily)
MGSIRGTSGILKIGFSGYVYYQIETHFALWRMDTSLWITWIFAFVAYDFFYYWFHRISHERQIFWASHVAHHQSEEYNLSTALRQTGTGFFISWIFYIPLFLIGVPSYVMVSVGTLNLIYQFWVHSRHIPKLGWYELFFVTPSNHRVHHAQNDIYIDKNYGGVFIIWDRFFSTFQEEQHNEECIYGIRGAIKTFDPVKANIHIYQKIFKDLSYSFSLRNFYNVITARAGWSPDGSDISKFDPENFEKHDPEIKTLTKFYAFIQFLCMSYAAVVLFADKNMEYDQGVVLVSIVIFSMYCTAKWLDAEKIIKIEYIKLVFIFVCLCYLYTFSPEILLINVLLVYLLLNIAFMPFLKRA